MIDLNGFGVSLNDPGVADSGGNERHNFPVVTSAGFDSVDFFVGLAGPDAAVDLAEGLVAARESIDSGAASARLAAVTDASQRAFEDSDGEPA